MTTSWPTNTLFLGFGWPCGLGNGNVLKLLIFYAVDGHLMLRIVECFKGRVRANVNFGD